MVIASRLMKTKLKLFVLLAVVMAAFVSAQAQTTAFTYHGRLNDNNAPVTGNYEMRFAIYDADVAGLIVAGPLPVPPVDVANGLFTVRVDFGAGIFTGPPRWLEVSVRPVGNPTFTTLSPRHELTSSPYAIRAATAGTATDVSNGSVVKSLNTLKDNVTLAAGANVTLTPSGNTLTIASSGAGGSGIWLLNGADTYYNGGNVGIGTTTPANKLTVRTPTLGYGLEHTDGDIRLSTFVGRSTGWLGTLSNHKLSFFANDNGLPNMITTLDTNGNFGIGTDNPVAKLDVVGDQMLWGNLRFGHQPRQMLNLFGEDFGIGVQTGNLYYRGGGFGWHVGGVHNDNSYDSGGGTTVMTLNTLGLSFGARFGQHLRLWSDNATRYFGFGIQASTLYQRVGNGVGDAFVWYKGGGHNDNQRNAGGGQTLMTLDEETGLVVNNKTTTKVLTITGGADLAEPFPFSSASVAEGSVVIIDDEHPGKLKLSARAYDTRVAGIVSGANGVNPGISLRQEGTLDGSQNVSLTGRVYVLADATTGSIKPGDLLTTSDTPGHAMEAADHSRAQGAILGKAMTGLKEGKGMVLVLVTLQ